MKPFSDNNFDILFIMTIRYNVKPKREVKFKLHLGHVWYTVMIIT